MAEEGPYPGGPEEGDGTDAGRPVSRDAKVKESVDRNGGESWTWTQRSVGWEARETGSDVVLSSGESFMGVGRKFYGAVTESLFWS